MAERPKYLMQIVTGAGRIVAAVTTAAPTG
jgi:hypothetical protein